MSEGNATGDPDYSVNASLKSLEYVVFCISVILCVLMGMLSTFGNGLVMYISHKRAHFRVGNFKDVTMVVKNLVVSDFLFGLIGSPLTIVFWYWGKKIME